MTDKAPKKSKSAKPKKSTLLALGGGTLTFTYGDGVTRPVEFDIQSIAGVETIFDSHENFVEQLEKRPAFAVELAVMALHGQRWGGDIPDDAGISAALKGVRLFELHDLIEAAWWDGIASPEQRDALQEGRPNLEAA